MSEVTRKVRSNESWLIVTWYCELINGHTRLKTLPTLNFQLRWWVVMTSRALPPPNFIGEDDVLPHQLIVHTLTDIQRLKSLDI